MATMDALEGLFVAAVGKAEIEVANTLVGTIGVDVGANVLVQRAIDLYVFVNDESEYDNYYLHISARHGTETRDDSLLFGITFIVRAIVPAGQFLLMPLYIQVGFKRLCY